MSQEIGEIDLGAIQNDVLRAGLDYWSRLKGSRPYPSRRQIVPRELGGLLRHAVLITVINNGEEYEFCIFGDAHVQGTGFNMQGSQIRDVKRLSPQVADNLCRVYGRVVEARQPYALRAVEYLPSGTSISSESVLLPIGRNESSIDHILVFTSYLSDNLVRERAAC